MIPILLYHKISKFDISGTWVTPNQFDQEMQYLYNQGYTTIMPDEIQKSEDRRQRTEDRGQRTEDRRQMTEDRKPKAESQKLLITFDDGYSSFYSIAFPTLLKYGFRATCFVVTGYIGKKSEWDVNFGKKDRHLDLMQIRELKQYGFVIGSHTRTHPDLTKLSIPKIKQELRDSKLELEDKLGEEVQYLSFPFGRYNKLIVNLAMETGYKLVFTSNPLMKEVLPPENYVIGRMGVYIIDQLPQFKAKLHKGVFQLIEARKAQVINSFSRGTWIWKTMNPFCKQNI
ncbi:MAG: polysaccharide deacetylase family protein [Candidatus Stahlbacteria bacterium]|nr:polysaccharide deacetylase family protein [Candidatus Stahlbacteria bacterium]